MTNPKVAGFVSAATTTTGVGSMFDLIPDDIGKLSALVGVILSLVLTYNHARKGHMERQILKAVIDSE